MTSFHCAFNLFSTLHCCQSYLHKILSSLAQSLLNTFLEILKAYTEKSKTSPFLLINLRFPQRIIKYLLVGGYIMNTRQKRPIPCFHVFVFVLFFHPEARDRKSDRQYQYLLIEKYIS